MAQEDAVANAPIVIDTYHARIHEGTSWKFTQTYSAVGNGDVVDTIMVALGALHCVPKLEAGGGALAEFHEVSSYTHGTSLNPVNRNLFKTHATSIFFHASASINVSSRSLFTGVIGSAGGFFTPGAGGESNFPEFVLKPGVYALRFTNVSGGADNFTVDFDFYTPSNAGD